MSNRSTSEKSIASTNRFAGRFPQNELPANVKDNMRRLNLKLIETDPEVSVTFRVRRSTAPSLLAAIHEISNVVGTRLETQHPFAQEDALTRAAIALGSLRAAMHSLATASIDPDY